MWMALKLWLTLPTGKQLLQQKQNMDTHEAVLLWFWLHLKNTRETLLFFTSITSVHGENREG